ncbi:MAG: hypothetical protein WC554_15000 [Clostridia bacterium]
MINETNFKKGINPKVAMGIGGINFGKEFEIEFEKYTLEWFEKLKQLEGKTITTEMRIFNLSNNIQVSDWQKDTIKIIKILEPRIKVDSIRKDNFIVNLYLWVVGEIDGEEYRCDLGDLNKKIYIE